MMCFILFILQDQDSCSFVQNTKIKDLAPPFKAFTISKEENTNINNYKTQYGNKT